MKKQRESFLNRMLMLVGLIALVAVVLFLSAVPDVFSGVAHASLAAGVLIAGVNYSGKSVVELKEFRGLVYQEYIDLKALCTTEKRDLTDPEISRRDELKKALDRIDKEIDIKSDEERMAKQYAGKQFKKDAATKEQREIASYSIGAAIRGYLSGKLEGLEGEMHAEAKREAQESNRVINGIGIPAMVISREARDLTVTGQSVVAGDQGGLSVQTTKQGFIDSLKARLVFSQLGSTFLPTLTGGNLSIPKLTTDSAPDWAATENVAAAASQPLFSSVELAPKRLTAKLAISNQLIAQSSLSVDQLIISNLQAKMLLKLEQAAINGAGAAGVPKGILNYTIGSVVGGANGLAPIYQNIIDLESAVANQNADLGKMGYLTNSKARGKMKSVPKVAGFPSYLWDSGQFPLNGYNVAVTNQVPSNLTKGASGAVCSAIIFGNWEELVFAQWGGLDLIIDNLTLAENNEIKLVMHSFWDIAVKHPESFAAMVDMLTT